MVTVFCRETLKETVITKRDSKVDNSNNLYLHMCREKYNRPNTIPVRQISKLSGILFSVERHLVATWLTPSRMLQLVVF